ncbi:MAG TPA: sulfotransferase [Rhizomicrobium sp.]|jgi:tetratricopeptide (TPR) repeat protein
MSSSGFTGRPPAQLQLFLRECDAALRSGDSERALRIADEAASQGLEHPNLLTLAAHRRMQMGDDASALTLAARAREMAPRSVDVLNAHGIALLRLGRAREALAAFDAALRAAPGTGMLRFNKALAHEKLGELDRVKRELESVVTLMPNHYEALAWLATLASQRNDSKATRDYAARALTINPNVHAATLAIATVDVADKDYDAALALLRPLLSDPATTPVNRAVAQSLIGDALDGLDRPKDAFASYAASQRSLRDHYAPIFESTGQEPSDHRVARLTRYFEGADPAQWRARKSGATKPVHAFLVGFPRSGTTLLETVLGSHPDIETMEERDALLDAATTFTGSDEALDRLAAISPDEAERFRDAYWKAAGAFGHAADKAVFLDKMPLNTILLPIVAKLFPDAKILFALRDPRDVVLSCFRRRFGMTAQMFQLTSLDGAANYYDAVMNLGARYRDTLGLDLTETRHENLLDDFEGETGRLCAFLGVAWRESMKDFAARARTTTIDTPSGAQIARGLSREGAGQWRRYAHELAPVLPKLAPWVARFSYPES